MFAVYTNTDTAPDANTPQQGAAGPIATIASPPTYDSLMLPPTEAVAMTSQQGAAAPTDAIDSAPTYEKLMLPSTAAGSRRSYRV